MNGGTSAYDVFEAAVRAHGGSLDGPNLPPDPGGWLNNPGKLPIPPILMRVGMDLVHPVTAEDLWPGWEDGPVQFAYVDFVCPRAGV